MSDFIYADSITNVSYAHGVLRVSLGRQTAENQVDDAGMLIMPITQAGPFVNSLANSLKQLEAKVRELQQQQQQEPQSAQPETSGGEGGKELHFGE